MRRLCTLWGLGAFLLFPALGHGEPSVGMLGLEPVEVPQSVADTITKALKARGTDLGLRVVSGKPLLEMKLVFGCLDEAAPCMAQVGTSLGVDRLLFGAVRKTPLGYSVTLKLVHVAKASLEKELTFHINREEMGEQALRTESEKWLTAVLGLKVTASVIVTASVPGARVGVDGSPVGVFTGSVPVVASNLPPGRHEVTVTAQGHRRFVALVHVGRGETMEVKAELEPEPALGGGMGGAGEGAPGGGKEDHAHPGRAARYAAWGTGGAALATFAVATVAAIRVGQLSDKKLSAMREACEVDPEGPSCLRYIPECGDSTVGTCRYNVIGNDACRAAASKDTFTGLPRNQEVADICSEGRAWATATWVLFPVGGALTAAAGYFIWSGYLAKKEPAKERGLARLRLTVEPVVGPGLTAVTASVRF